MCRSQADGGRRCSGSSRSGGRGGVPAASGGDKPSRRVDGKPETDADRRFFDLRQSGYAGPIDQDGYRSHLEGTGKNARFVRDEPEPSPVQRLMADMQLVDARRGPGHGRERAEADAEDRYWRGRL